jgi:hypothetical protein
MSWGGLHPRLACRGHFQAMAKPPIITCHLIRITVEKLPAGARSPASRTWTYVPMATFTASTWSTPGGSRRRPWAGTDQDHRQRQTTRSLKSEPGKGTFGRNRCRRLRSAARGNRQRRNAQLVVSCSVKRPLKW